MQITQMSEIISFWDYLHELESDKNEDVRKEN